MATCPFAVSKPMPGFSGTYSSGPFKIVHHTTQGTTASGAFDAYTRNKSAPHFTVDETTVYQHFDTTRFSRSLANPPRGVQTNRESAIQIEVVGYAEAKTPEVTIEMSKTGRRSVGTTGTAKFLKTRIGTPRIPQRRWHY